MNQGSDLWFHEYSFDAYGRRCDKTDWSYNLASQPELFADRGFTGHEYLKYFNLYNMNGRLYDPLVARFLNADPFVQDPGNTQNFNRYSYCLNNPLKYVDLSGNTLFMWASLPEGNNTSTPGSLTGNIDVFDEDGNLLYYGIPTSDNRVAQYIGSTVDALEHSTYGGEWSRSSGTHYYGSREEALFAGSLYNDLHNSWDYTLNGSFGATWSAYWAATSGDYGLTASLDGVGMPNVSQEAYQAAKDNFLGSKAYTGRCSNFIFDVYVSIGHPLGTFNIAVDTGNYPTLEQTTDPVPGDIVQYLKADGAIFNHVAIYAGDNSMFSSSTSAGMIKLQNFSSFNNIVTPHFYHYVGY
jgi:RHS repeat-associated protein